MIKMILCSLVMLVGYNHLFHLAVLEAWLGTSRDCQQVYIDSICNWSCAKAIMTSWDLLGSIFFAVKKGIYEAIDGDFLDSHNLSLLNPYMVCVSDICLSDNLALSFKIYQDYRNLSWIYVVQPNLSSSWLFQRAMSAKEPSNVSPDFINELLYANFQSMQVGLSLVCLEKWSKCLSFLFGFASHMMYISSFSCS